MNLIDRVKVAFVLHKDNFKVFLICAAVLLIGLVYVYSLKDIQNFDQTLYSEISKPLEIEYVELFGPPSLDSAEPISNGILINYSFLYDTQIIHGKYYLTKMGYQQIKQHIDSSPDNLFVRYEVDNPYNSIITFR